MLLGVLQGALSWANAQLDLVGSLIGRTGTGAGWTLVVRLVTAGLAWEIRQRKTGETREVEQVTLSGPWTIGCGLPFVPVCIHCVDVPAALALLLGVSLKLKQRFTLRAPVWTGYGHIQ